MLPDPQSVGPLRLYFHLMNVAASACGCAVLLVAAVCTASSLNPRARDAADRARTKIVILKTATSRTTGAATGFVVRPGVVITAGHAVSHATGITAWLNGVSYPAKLAAVHPDLDVAAVRLRTPELRLKPLALAETSLGLEPGEELLILAGPSQGADATGDPADRVLISARLRRRGPVRDPNGKLEPMLIMDASVERGDSGSPVLRVKDGSVVGVLSSRELPHEDGVSRTAYAVPAEAIQPWLSTALE
ncbi:MAG: hypothetical protein K0Q72_1532 [Armatimonadetes bacterium]|jgi:S1-C subfamily serine protease|nr:hypothetical protein [Armatimonadota bacterium]